MTLNQLQIIETLADEMVMGDCDLGDIADGIDPEIAWRDLSTVNASVLIDELIRMKSRGSHQ